MDYFNIRWPETISQKTSREVALLAFGEQEVLGGEKDGSKDIFAHWDGKRRTQSTQGVGGGIHIFVQRQQLAFFIVLWNKELSRSLNQTSTSEQYSFKGD